MYTLETRVDCCPAFPRGIDDAVSLTWDTDKRLVDLNFRQYAAAIPRLPRLE